MTESKYFLNSLCLVVWSLCKNLNFYAQEHSAY